MLMPKKRLSMPARRAVAGYLFILPFILGILLFFLKPLIQSVIFSFNSVNVSGGIGPELDWLGLTNYKKALFSHPTYVRVLTESFLSMLASVPITLIFSFFAATLLNQDFKGRTVARAVFFLPVILTTGVIVALENADFMLNLMRNGIQSQSDTAGSNMLNTVNLRQILSDAKLNASFVGYITGAVDGIYGIISSSGVQMLIFLAGLQSVPRSLYEASNIEGATGWENFWKITFPMVSPLIVVNLLYSIIDNMTSAANPMMKLVREVAFQQTNYGFSTAMAWIYFLVIIVFLAISVTVVSRLAFYQV